MKYFKLILASILTVTLMIWTTYKGFAQANLVPNGSFEDFLACPDTAESITSAKFWLNPTGYTPDYFNACDSAYITTGNWWDLNRGIPYNTEGTQIARTGNAYAGLITADIGQNEREYIQVELTDSLLSGYTYYVEFFVSAGDSSQYTANNIGAYFSTTPVSSNNTYVLPFIPQIENNASTNPLDDRYGWTKVSGSFVAQGGEKYLTIGNFKDDASTDTTSSFNSPQWSLYSYHYIDDVSVLDMFPNSVQKNGHSYVSVFPNPSNGIFHVYSAKQIESFLVYSSLGQLIFTQFPEEVNFKVDLSTLSEGVYFILFKINNSIITNKIIIKN
jgi:hypothetical protein